MPRPVFANALLSGKSRSCGCGQREAAKKVCGDNFRTHGGSKERLYKIWAGMHKRCYNKNATNYKDYGGRGITVCDSWHKFEPFQEWSLSHGYNDSLSIDRIDNELGYSPENCRWTVRVAQANNRRTSKMYTIDGETHTLKEWSNIFGVNYKYLWKKVCSCGVPIESFRQSS